MLIGSCALPARAPPPPPPRPCTALPSLFSREYYLTVPHGPYFPHPNYLPASVQARLGDSNRNLAAKVLQLLGDISKAMGSAFDKVARPVLLSPAVSNLSDNKKQVCA